MAKQRLYSNLNLEAKSLADLNSDSNSADPVEQTKNSQLKENLTNNLTGLSSATLKRITLSNQQRIQSQLFTVTRTINPLVAAAAPLLTMATRLGELPSLPDFNLLYDQLCHEVKVFEYKAQSLGYRPQVVIAARYLLCSLIDETIQHSPWGESSDWHVNNLLSHFQNEPDGSDRCFYILEQSLKDPILYLDLIELFYLCLSLGLEGKYRGLRNGQDDINSILENLFQLVRQYRGEPCRKLMIEHQETIRPKRILRWRIPPIWFTAMVASAVFIAVYWPYHTQLEQLASPIESILQSINVSANSPITTNSNEYHEPSAKRT